MAPNPSAVAIQAAGDGNLRLLKSERPLTVAAVPPRSIYISRPAGMLGLQLSGISHTNFLFSLFVRNGEKD
jgi:hypothetical protein